MPLERESLLARRGILHRHLAQRIDTPPDAPDRKSRLRRCTAFGAERQDGQLVRSRVIAPMLNWLADGETNGGIPEPCAVSWLAVKTVLPSGPKAAKRSGDRHRIVGPIGFAVAASRNRAVPSWLPVRIVVPSGLRASDVTAPS